MRSIDFDCIAGIGQHGIHGSVWRYLYVEGYLDTKDQTMALHLHGHYTVYEVVRFLVP